MKKLDPPLRAYLARVHPEMKEALGYSVVDYENIRIFYFDIKGVKTSKMIHAPLPHELWILYFTVKTQ